MSDVFAWRGRPAAWGEDLVHVVAADARDSRPEDRKPLRRLGEDAVIAVFLPEEGHRVVAAARPHRAALLGPFAARAEESTRPPCRAGRADGGPAFPRPRRDRPHTEGGALMEGAALVVVAAVVFVWGAVSARLKRADLTAPIVFTAIGAALAGLGLVHSSAAPETLKPLVEITLVWVLFSDAARVRVHALRGDLGLVLRLLVVGLPLTVLAGWGLAAWLFPALGLWLALLVGAALAPTDAALGVPVVTNTAVPSRVRRLITVESGLNDGIATPVVMVAIAGAVALESSESSGAGGALVELAIGVGVGAAVGLTGGWLLRWARHRGWAAEDFTGIAVLALALLAYLAALAVDGNGFVAAFCGGIAFGAAAGRRGPEELAFLEQASGAVSLLVWLAFGAIAVPIALDRLDWTLLLYAVLSLTAVRMVPVALALIGSGTDRNTVLFIGWFGPRGLASLVFALLALEGIGAGADDAVAVIAITVLLSVLAHGVSAAPLAARYGRFAAANGPEPGGVLPALAVRGLPRPRNGHRLDRSGSSDVPRR